MKQKLKEIIYKRYNISFSKSGDDIQLYKLINKSTPGTYIDIGCWHPIKASNTYYFSLRGWKGICIDPNPEMKDLFHKLRSKDIFINKAVSNSDKLLKYYMVDESSMNTFDLDFIKEHQLSERIKRTIEVPSVLLKEVLTEQLTPNDRLDFFDVDVEGYDLEVLKTNDWDRYRPKIVQVETNVNLKADLQSDITNYLESVDYVLHGKSVINGDLGNLFFKDAHQ